MLVKDSATSTFFFLSIQSQALYCNGNVSSTKVTDDCVVLCCVVWMLCASQQWHGTIRLYSNGDILNRSMRGHFTYRFGTSAIDGRWQEKNDPTDEW
jgi:hypothetical protein